MIELEVNLGPKTGLETVQNEKHVEVEVASPDESNQAPLVRVTGSILQDKTCQILSLDENPRWSPSVAISFWI